MVPELKKVYASVPGAGLGASLSVALGMTGLSGGSGAVAIIDLQSLKPIARLPAGVFPDGIAYDPDDRRIFVSDELGKALTVIDAGADKVIGRIAMGGEVGNVQYDPLTRKIYAPVQTRNALAAVDPATATLETRFDLPGCRHPHGLHLAPGAAIAYAACDGNDRLRRSISKPQNHLRSRRWAMIPMCWRRCRPARLYVAGESGLLSVFDTSDPAHPRKLGDVFIGEDAHSVAVDPTTHRLFLPLRNLNGKAVMRILAPK